MQTNKTKESVAEFEKELKDIAGGKPITEEEFSDTRNRMVRGYAQQFEALGRIDEQIADLWVAGLPMTELQKRLRRDRRRSPARRRSPRPRSTRSRTRRSSCWSATARRSSRDCGSSTSARSSCWIRRGGRRGSECHPRASAGPEPHVGIRSSGYRRSFPIYLVNTSSMKSRARGSFDWPSQKTARSRTSGLRLVRATRMSSGTPSSSGICVSAKTACFLTSVSGSSRIASSIAAAAFCPAFCASQKSARERTAEAAIPPRHADERRDRGVVAASRERERALLAEPRVGIAGHGPPEQRAAGRAPPLGQPERRALAERERPIGGDRPPEGGVGGRPGMERDGGDGGLGDVSQILAGACRGQERLEPGDAFLRADAVEPDHGRALGVDGTVERERAQVFDAPAGDPGQHQEVGGASSAVGESSFRRFNPPRRPSRQPPATSIRTPALYPAHSKQHICCRRFSSGAAHAIQRDGPAARSRIVAAIPPSATARISSRARRSVGGAPARAVAADAARIRPAAASRWKRGVLTCSGSP